MSEEALMRIGEMAAFFKISVKTLRLYEKKGLIRPVKTDPQTGYRYYAASQIAFLGNLLEMRRLGFSLVEIRDLLSDGLSNEKFMAALTHKKMAWQDAVANAEDKITHIDKIFEQLARDQPATPLHEMTEEERAWLLSKLICVEDSDTRNNLSAILWL